MFLGVFIIWDLSVLATCYYTDVNTKNLISSIVFKLACACVFLINFTVLNLTTVDKYFIVYGLFCLQRACGVFTHWHELASKKCARFVFQKENFMYTKRLKVPPRFV